MTFRQNPDVIQSGQQDEIVLLNPESGQYLSLDGVGAFIWRLIDDTNEASLAQIVGAVCQTYEIDAKTATQDAHQFTETLLQNGLLLTEQLGQPT
ncbi:MAG: PqqD family protein [Bacteroidota bacterium]